MNREQLEHLIRAAGEVSGQRDLIIIGSQAILGAFPYATEDALMSREADMYPRDHPEAADQIEGSWEPTHGSMKPMATMPTVSARKQPRWPATGSSG